MATSTANMATANPASADLTPRPWSLPTRVGFRFVFCYLLMLSFGMVGIMREFVLLFGTHASPTRGLLDPLWLRVVPWVAVHLLGLRMGAVSTDSSDTLFDYVFVVCQVLLAAGATLVWSLLDGRRTEYRVLLAWLRRIVGLVLACMLFTYGTDKIFPIQFGTLSLVRLSRRVGDLDPFNLLWTFMAGSTLYTVFSGAAEILAGVLLLLPRCETVGALFSAAVMTNVFVLNLAYDVPVKLISSHLLLCAIFLAACESRRLVPALLSDLAISPRPPVSLSRRAWLNRSLAFLLPAAGFAFLVFCCLLMSRYYRFHQARSASSPLYGIWAVDEFQVKGNPTSPLFTPKLAAELDVHPGQDRWQQLIIDTSRESAILLGNGVLDSIVVTVSPDGKTATLTDSSDAAWKCDFRVERPSADLLNLDGRINGVEATVRVHRLPKEKLLLTNARFHWVRQD
jgi:uncharacterized membrane protein YphA (DoxX/SURF4 family)